MQTLSQKLWKGKEQSLSYEEFSARGGLLNEAPGVNILARIRGIKGVILEIDSLQAGDVTGTDEVGYGYRVEFSLKCSDNLNGTVLFESPNAKLYLRDPKTGCLSFERDGYCNSFAYVVPDNELINLAIEGDHLSTTLYVDGKQACRLEKEVRYYSQDKKTKMYYLPTLVFPLEKCGEFKGEITNLKVIQR